MRTTTRSRFILLRRIVPLFPIIPLIPLAMIVGNTIAGFMLLRRVRRLEYRTGFVGR